MKRLLLLMCFLPVLSAFGEEPTELKCKYIGWGNMFRCENNEVLCYGNGVHILQCKFKTKKEKK